MSKTFKETAKKPNFKIFSTEGELWKKDFTYFFGIYIRFEYDTPLPFTLSN